MALCVCWLCSLSVFLCYLCFVSFVLFAPLWSSVPASSFPLVLQRFLCSLKQIWGHVEADSKRLHFMLFFMDLMPPCRVHLFVHGISAFCVFLEQHTAYYAIVFFLHIVCISCISRCICFVHQNWFYFLFFHQSSSPFFLRADQMGSLTRLWTPCTVFWV